MAKSQGQTLIERAEAFVNRYVKLPGDIAGGNQGLVMALWAVHTWLYDRFQATPYLTITASTKQAGKTLAMDVLGVICRGAKAYSTLRPLMLVRVIEAFDGHCTLFLDEAEKMSNAALGDLRSIMTSGYRVGGKHGISAGKEFIEFRTYAPKCFALIGDVTDVVRDRSIVIHLRRAEPDVNFYSHRTEAEEEGRQIELGIRAFFTSVPELVEPTFMQGREREIWTVLYSIAKALHLDRGTMDRLESAMADLSGLKSAEARHYSKAVEEVGAADDMIGVKALRDLAASLREGEPGIFSALAVERMKGIPTSPWRTFKGSGLTMPVLSQLVSRFGLSSSIVRMQMGKGARTAQRANGYKRSDIETALQNVGVK